jgi:Tfp pilus assembly protein PilX
MLQRSDSASITDRAEASASSPGARPRDGFALAAAIFAIVVVGALIAGAYFASFQEGRVGRNMLIEQRSFSLAEYGLNFDVSNWDKSRNMLPPRGMAVGAIDSNKRVIRQGDTAYVRVTRLNDNTFWVVSTGSANVGSDPLQSVRRTNMVVRIAYPSMKVKGAITSNGTVTVAGSSGITGFDTDPTGWQNECGSVPDAGTLAGVVVASKTSFSGDTTVTNTGSNTTGVTGSPRVLVDNATVTDSNTYVRYGSETWNSLASNADVRLTSYFPKTEPQATADGTKCDTQGTYHETNWGEPFHDSTLVNNTVPKCVTYFPIIYSDSSLHIAANSRGQGILMVNGDLTLEGNFDWDGIIITKDDLLAGTGSVNITGALLVRNANLNKCKQGDKTCNGVDLSGNFMMHYSKCAIENSLRASAQLIPVKKRAWAQLF